MSCKKCSQWCDATAECAVQLKCISNGLDVPTSVEAATELNSEEENFCEYQEVLE